VRIADPTAVIQGGNRTVTPGTLLLDGSSSYDPDGEPLTYVWSCMLGGSQFGRPCPGVTLANLPTVSAQLHTSGREGHDIGKGK
jgi:hypothetical protein